MGLAAAAAVCEHYDRSYFGDLDYSPSLLCPKSLNLSFKLFLCLKLEAGSSKSLDLIRWLCFLAVLLTLGPKTSALHVVPIVFTQATILPHVSVPDPLP